MISQLDVLDEPDRPNPFDLITDSDVDEVDNAVFRIEEDDEIIDVDIYRIGTFSVLCNTLSGKKNRGKVTKNLASD